MRHVAVMTTTGMIGLTFMFLIDAITLFWVSKLENESFMAAMGFAWTVQFFTISVGIAFMIATTALVSRSLGAENWEDARKQTTVFALLTFVLLSIAVIVLLIFNKEILASIGASGSTLETASTFLLISVPSLPIMAMGMIGSAVLRAEGDGIRSMMVTISSGIVAAIVDPLFIFGFDMGIQGAALGVSVARVVSAILAIYFVIKVKDLAASINFQDVKKWYLPFAMIAIPTILTQLASPTGNMFATSVISEFGESAMAGWAVLGRVTVVAFGGVFALSGAIGGIIGQNFGANKFDRVRSSYRDALLFSTFYVFLIWGMLVILTPFILGVFNLSDGAADVVKAFNYIAAGSYIFAGALYVSNASFNNLGKPLYSTLFNWVKDGVVMLPFCIFGAAFYGSAGVVYGQGLAYIFAGIMSVVFGWWFISRVEKLHKKVI
ncbi:MATE family efflux transporter [Amylibacter sp.]|nr:MATE family efflux transporter [Amylibacter sp.]